MRKAIDYDSSRVIVVTKDFTDSKRQRPKTDESEENLEKQKDFVQNILRKVKSTNHLVLDQHIEDDKNYKKYVSEALLGNMLYLS